ncbi:MAG: hypothetical protein COV67_11450 [Nitrospinae bacterium CG11_big_fil_rev_8_21_14_0_20_56_8]|nr:MAG: hypothetical protein COV67_11450 [Nitrospinae bacterium CG11_big_fil_rev_8_21_14_0_20_56_8]
MFHKETLNNRRNFFIIRKFQTIPEVRPGFFHFVILSRIGGEESGLHPRRGLVQGFLQDSSAPFGASE